MGAEISRRALLSLLLLSVRLSIFNLSCGLPIGLSTTRRHVIGRQTQCATLAPSFPLSRLRSSAAMQGGLLAFSSLFSPPPLQHGSSPSPPFQSLLSSPLSSSHSQPKLCVFKKAHDAWLTRRISDSASLFASSGFEQSQGVHFEAILLLLLLLLHDCCCYRGCKPAAVGESKYLLAEHTAWV